jgi:protein-disulfide isomerase
MATTNDGRDDAGRRKCEHDQAGGRRRRLTRLGAVLGAAAAAVAVLVAVSAGSGRPAASSSGPAAGADATRTLLAGIPQHGIVLGDPKAPVRVVEFADLQCPFCREYTLTVFPGLVRRYVRPGKVRLEFRALAFIGPDSVRAARVAEAAGLQDRLWNVVDLAYRNQGRENSGWATDATLRGVAAAVPGLDAGRVFAQRDGAAVTATLNAAARAAQRSGVTGTPTFLVGRGSALQAVDAAGLPAAIAAALRR